MKVIEFPIMEKPIDERTKYFKISIISFFNSLRDHINSNNNRLDEVEKKLKELEKE
jgi:hypothetical protein